MDLKTVDHLLTTTRTVRKRLDLDRPVEPAVIERCIEIAMQHRRPPISKAGTSWWWKTQRCVRLWRTSIEKDSGIIAPCRNGKRHAGPIRTSGRCSGAETGASSTYLNENLHRVPMFIIPCVEAQMEQVPHLSEMRDHPSLYNASMYGSILPAAWSLMLALRARGLGAAWTTLHLMHEEEAAQVLGIPKYVIQVALLPVAYYTGSDFRPAKRLPARDLTHWNTWGGRR